MLTESARNIIRFISPSLHKKISWWRNSRAYNRLCSKVIRTLGLTVNDGIFKGMAYIDTAVCSAILPKIIGCYEAELAEDIESLPLSKYGLIMDIGCAEGYYAVGLAIRTSSARIIAFDTDPEARRLCRKLADINGVTGKIEIWAECTADDMNKLLTHRSLVICDCEGAETDLIDPVSFPALLRSDIVVEIHEFVKPGAGAIIASRFASTHTIKQIKAAERDSAAFRLIDFLSHEERIKALSEMRPPGMSWLIMRAKSNAD